MEKHVLVTGADRGLGLALVEIFLNKNFTVFAGKYNTDLKDLELLKIKFDDRLNIIELDISNDKSVENAFKKIIQKTDKLDIIINNAAILGDTETTIDKKLDFTEISNVININTLGPLRITNTFYSLLMKSETKLLVNVSSEAGSIGGCYRNGWFGYCMSKAALNMQSNLLHNYMKERGGMVIVFHPGWMRTYMKGKKDLEAAFEPEESAEKIIQMILNCEKYRTEKSNFIDIDGKSWEW